MSASLQVGLLLRQPVVSPRPSGWSAGPFHSRLPLRVVREWGVGLGVGSEGGVLVSVEAAATERGAPQCVSIPGPVRFVLDEAPLLHAAHQSMSWRGTT